MSNVKTVAQYGSVTSLLSYQCSNT